jgi:DNA-binding transcriptional LysR family regulator
MQDLNDLYYYARVVEQGGFSAAGRVLGIPKSKLSRRIALLEQRLGVRLLQRSTRRFAITEIGQVYYERCKAMLVEAEAAEDVIAVTHAEPCGSVRMSCPVALLHAHVGAMLADFLAAYPRVVLHLEATNRRVDLIGEGVDLALRVRPLPLEDSDLVLRILARRRQALVASPTLLARYSVPYAPTDLASWPSLALGTPQQHHAWTLFNLENTQADIDHTPRLITRDMMALRAAAVAGVGIVQLPTMLIRAELAQGTLMQVLPDWTPRCELIHAVYPSRRGLLSSVRLLIDDLVARFKMLGDD